MTKITIILIYLVVIVGSIFAGWQLGIFLNQVFIIPMSQYLVDALTALICGCIGFGLSLLVARWVIKFGSMVKQAYRQLNLADVILGFAGLVVGLLLALLISWATNIISIPVVGPFVPALLSIILAYIGLTLFLSKREELSSLLSIGAAGSSERSFRSRRSERRYLLDTNVIIDGRIAEVLKSGILEGQILIPSFVLSELQYVADSPDPIRRARGRRGLDVLNRIQKDSPAKIEIPEIKLGGEPVDQRLLKLTKSLDAALITNDFNLAQIARLQQVRLVNLNELANALKPVVLPGEEIQVAVIKEGKEADQGVGYLDDGTMVVLEEGRHLIGESITATVTSILQTSAGRMVFARPMPH